MTRKKFIKQLMAAGAHRNTAGLVLKAAHVNQNQPNYTEILENLLTIRREYKWIGPRNQAKMFNSSLRYASMLILQEQVPASGGAGNE